MNYVEVPPPDGLRRQVQCVWRLTAAHAAMPVQTVYPDGRCELIVHLGQPMSRYRLDEGWRVQSHCLFAAQMRSAIRLAANGAVDCLGVRLTPVASRALLEDALPTLADEIIDLTQTQPRFAQSLIAACRAYALDSNATHLWQCIEALVVHIELDNQIEQIVAAIDAASGDIAIAELQRAGRMSLRSLQARFLRSVGLTAKEYARVQRLQATIRHLDGQAQSLAQMAADAGFADQAHATREVVRLTGLTPGKLRRALQAEREGDATLRMAAAFVRGHARQATAVWI